MHAGVPPYPTGTTLRLPSPAPHWFVLPCPCPTCAQELVSGAREPITPFIAKLPALAAQRGVSCVLVIGGSGQYFDVAGG